MRTVIRPTLLVSGAVTALLLMCAMEVCGADYSLKPKITVGEEYTDNVFDDRTYKSDYITRVQPGFLFKYNAPLWDWDLDYAYDYRYYANRSRTEDTTQKINGSGLVKIIDEKLFLQLSDVYQKVALNIARDTTNESLFVNQTDKNVGTVSPYLLLHLSNRFTLKAGYSYLNTWYKDPSAVSRQDHAGFLNGSYELTPKFFLTADYTFTREMPSNSRDFYRQECYLGPRYEYADKSTIYARGGFISTYYINGPRLFKPSWNAGLTHSFDTAVLDLSTGTTYTDDPFGTSTLQTFYRGSLVKTLPRGSVILKGSYTKLSTEIANQNGTILDNGTYSGSLSGILEFTSELRGNLGLTYENYRDKILNGVTDRYYVDCGAIYSFGKDLSAGLSYRYADYSSAEIVADNRRINRVTLEVKKIF